MHYRKLVKLCEDTIEANPEALKDSVDDLLSLTIPEPKSHNGYRVRLFKSRGPYATVICGSRGRLTVKISARRLLDYLNGKTIMSELEG